MPQPLTRLDRLLLATLLPAFVLVLGLHVREVERTGLQQPPIFATGRGPDGYPVVGGLRLERGGEWGALRPGDRLLRVGDQDLRGQGYVGFDAWALAEAGRAAQVPLRFERDGVVRTVELHMKRNEHPWYRVPFMAAVAIVALVILLRSGGTPDARLFFSGLMTLAIFETPFYGGPPLQTRLHAAVFHALGPVSVALLVAAARRLPAEVPEALRPSRRWSALALLFIVARIPYFLGGPIPPQWTPRLVLACDALFLLTGLGIGSWNARHALPTGRRRVKWALLGGLLGILPMMLVLLVQPLLSPGLFRQMFQYAALSAVAFPLGLLVAILRENLFDIDRLLSSTATYALAVAGAVALALALAAPLARLVTRATALESDVSMLAVVAALAALALPVAARLRPRVEGLLFPERVALVRGLHQLLLDLSDCESAEELLRLVEERLLALLRPARAALFQRRGGRFAVDRGPGASAGEVAVRGPLALALESDPVPRDARALRRLAASLPDDERALLDELAPRLLLPLRSGKDLAAFLALGPKRSGDQYVNSELTLLGAVAEKASAELVRLREVAVAASERERAESARRSMEAAQEANRAKSRFLAAASHDLRQPLHALGLFVERLAERAGEDDALVGQIQLSVQALTAQFDALLDLSRLDAGGVEPRVLAFDLGPELARLAAEYAEAARAKGLALRFDTVRSAVRSDPVLLGRILHNLLSNAIRYTDAGEVHLRTRPRPDGIAIEVADTGRGIPPDQHRAIFGEFVQLGEAGRGQGLGLGLSIVERTARLLGHRLEVESEPGLGSVFRVVVPTAAAAEVPAARPGAGPLAGRAVLLVEDDAVVREAMAGLLESWGCRVTRADGHAQALASLGSPMEVPELIIADYRLEGEASGIDVIQRVRDRAGASVPALVVSGEAAAASIDAIRASGLPFLAKPVRPARLRALLGELLRPH